MAVENEHRGRVVDFWRAVELFSPPAIEKVDQKRKVFRVADDMPLPWESRHRLAGVDLEPHLTWRHRVFLGCYPLWQTTDVLAEAFGDDAESYDARLDQETAVAAILVDGDGMFLDGSPILSASAWATGRLIRGAAFAVEDLESAQAETEKRLTELFVPLTAEGDTAGRPPVDVETLKAACDIVVEMLGIRDVLDAAEIRVQSTEIARRRAAEPADDFLNSFLIGDLATVAGQVRAGRYGNALRSYLSGEQCAERIDIRRQPDVSLAVTQPRATPLGRWPSNPEHPLALSQQFAVNQILGDPSGPEIYAVNGPPGTGKTTMLRDLVAGLVVRRAEALAGLRVPADAFTGRLTWKLDGRTFSVNKWRPDLVGHEIVVASSNNGAVENVTLEIPGKDAIDPRWLDAGDHFRDLATALLRAAKDDKPGGTSSSPPEAWALVAAMLGKKDNRNRFNTAVWFGSKKDDAEPTLLDALNTMASTAPEESWQACVSRFKRVADVAVGALSRRAAAHDALVSVASSRRARDLAADEASGAQQQVGLLESRLHDLHVAMEQFARDVDVRGEARRRHRTFRPNFFWALIDRPGYRSWRAEDDTYAGQVRDATQTLSRLRAEYDELNHALLVARDALVSAQGRFADAAREVLRREAVLHAARAAWGDVVPDSAWCTDERQRELAAPWSDAESNAARSELFLAALRLHRDFLTHQAAAMRQNLWTAVRILSGSAPRDLDEDVARAAWQSLFFVVPVVSTTFASVGRMFSHLTAEALGWLFVDEAGQAAPQNAVGALWRCRHAVVVGDPLQLEPVVVLPLRAQQSLRLATGVDERWLPARGSVQTLSDDLMRVGTWLPDGEGGRRWVGAPLRVHRRCDDPMFTVVNQVVYDGMMISAVGARDELTLPSGRPMPETKWLDVPSDSSERHWVPAEGKRLGVLLRYLKEQGFSLADVMVIGPFRDVARESRRIVTSLDGDGGGTIHTAQGKESDVVVLVLGSDPQSTGARQWASSTPNLLNVAVSRAKRRLYVIGDRDAWQQQRYFADLARMLPFRD